MTESGSVNNNNDDFKFRIRNIKKNPDDYKSNKKEKFLFDYLSKNTYHFTDFFGVLDREDGTRGVITKGDIDIFLSFKDVQKKNITEEDVINFLNKVKDLNPTEKEQAYSQINFVDEDNNSVITDEIYSLFDRKQIPSYGFRGKMTGLYDKIDKGFELFDLNGDGTLDDAERSYLQSNSDGKRGYDQLKTFLTALDKAGDGNADNVISTEDKMRAYNSVFFDRLKNLELKNEAGQSLITPEILALFENGVVEAKFDDLVSADGSLKPGFELFDINGDGKLDELEKSYFSSGGHALSDDTSKFTSKSLLDSLEAYDKFGISAKGNDRVDNLIKSKDSNNLYNVLSSAHYIVNSMKGSEEFPENIRQMYVDALKEVRIGEYVTRCSTGVCDGNYIGINYAGRDEYDVNSILIHELTHYLLINKTGMGKNTYLMQEVETFYMQYKLYNLESKLERDNPRFQAARSKPQSMINSNGYITIANELKRKNPDLSEKEVALETFLRTYYSMYDTRYSNEQYGPDQLRANVRASNKYVMLK